jgi:hypothetical protein
MLALGGCTHPELRIIDSSGVPIEGAKVVGTSMSFSGQCSYSDKQGHAKIPWAVQPTKWISVYHAGYQPVENIDISQNKPIVVRMEKAAPDRSPK